MSEDGKFEAAAEAAAAKPESFAGPKPRRQGEKQAGTMRRIGALHAIVTPAIVAQVIDINSIQHQLDETNRTIERARRQLAVLQQQREQLETKLAQFQAAPIERIDGDPDVPQEAPKPDEPEPKPEKPAT